MQRLGDNTTQQQLQTSLQDMKCGESMGNDGLMKELLFKNILQPVLITVCDMCECGSMSESKKTSLITLMCKYDCPSNQMTNVAVLVDYKLFPKICCRVRKLISKVVHTDPV